MVVVHRPEAEQAEAQARQVLRPAAGLEGAAEKAIRRGGLHGGVPHLLRKRRQQRAASGDRKVVVEVGDQQGVVGEGH
ncbi:MAG: hypothetical protein ACK56F_01355, partial [bacterium]